MIINYINYTCVQQKNTLKIVLNYQHNKSKLIISMQERQQRELELKVIHLNSELEQQKQQKQQLMVQYERIKKLLNEANHQILQNKRQSENKTHLINKIKKEKNQLEAILKSSQTHRRVLYDYLFVDDKLNQPLSSLKTQNQLMQKLYEINDYCSHKNYTQTLKILQERNAQIVKISAQYNQLLKKHLKSANQYHGIINNLKSQVFKLKKNEEIKSMIEKEKKNMGINEDYQSLSVTNKTLMERLDMLIQKIRLNEDQIGKLKSEVEDKKFKIAYLEKQLQKEMQINPKTPEVQEYLQIVQQKQSFKKLYQQLNEKYQQLAISYPSLVNNQDTILKFMDKYKNIHAIEADRKLKEVAVQSLTKKLRKAEQESIKQKKRADDYYLKLDGGTRYYDFLIERFKEFIVMINPHYQVYFWNQLELDQKQLESIKTGNSPTQQTKLILQNQNLKQMLERQKEQSSTKAEENVKLRSIMQAQVKKLTQLQAINFSLSESLLGKNKYNQKNFEPERNYIQYLLSQINKIQNERNKLEIEGKDKETKIISLMVENQYLKNRTYEEVNSKNIYQAIDSLVEMNICRPSIVWVEINKDLTDVNANLKQFQSQIKKLNEDYEHNVAQVRASYESKIIELKQRVLMLENQQKEVAEPNIRQSSQDLAIQEQNPEPVLNQTNTMLDLQYPMIGEDHDSIDQPLSNLNKESVEEMNKVLKNNQINMKNLISSYSQLKQKFFKLEQDQEERRNRQQQDRQIFRRQIDRYVEDLQMAKTRLIQSDKNVATLEIKLGEKSREIEKTKGSKQLEISQLKKVIQELNKQLQKLKRQDRLNELINDKQKNTQGKQRINLPEQTEYLIERMILKEKQFKEKQIRNIQEKENERITSSFEERIDVHSGQYIQRQKQQVQKMIKDGRINHILETAMQRIEEYKSKIEELELKLKEKQSQQVQGQQEMQSEDDI